MQDVKAALNGFLSSDEPRAVALTGNWGRGKAFLWNLAIEEFLRSKGVDYEVKYSYVSLFGISTISELKDSIFENAVSAKQVLAGATIETSLANAKSRGDEQAGSVPTKHAEDLGVSGRVKRGIMQGLFMGRQHPSLLEVPWLHKFGPFARSAALLSIHQ